MPFITQGKTNLTYILIVVILAVIAGGGILGYYYSWIRELDTRLAQLELRLPETKVPEMETPEEKVSPREVPADETADWKTYHSSKMGFSIKYPLEWIISKEEPVEQERFKGFEMGFSIESLENGYDTCMVYMALGKAYSEEKKELTLEEAIDDVRKSYNEDPQIIDLKEEETVLDGIPAVKLSSYITSWEAIGIDIFVPRKDEIFYIIFYEFFTTEPKVEVKECELVFNQMLSTFRFLE